MDRLKVRDLAIPYITWADSTRSRSRPHSHHASPSLHCSRTDGGWSAGRRPPPCWADPRDWVPGSS